MKQENVSMKAHQCDKGRILRFEAVAVHSVDCLFLAESQIVRNHDANDPKNLFLLFGGVQLGAHLMSNTFLNEHLR
jgi:hypothetical protein